MVQQACKSITALALLLVLGLAAAQPAKPPVALKPDAPERYIVVPGDTLWGIAQRFTDSPWRWPELWELNKNDLRNPHRIYPGNVIVLDRSKGRLSLAQGTVRLSPRTRAERLARDEIPSIPPSVIEPWLVRPLVVEPDGFEKGPTIVANQNDRVIIAAGSSAFVRGLGESKEDAWYVYRRGKPLVDPETQQTLGYEAIYLGTAQTTRAGNPATVLLTSTVQEVTTGDKLVAAGRPQPINYAPRAPSTQIKGRIMTIYGGVGKVGEAGPQSIITINRGRADGIEVGHVLALYNHGARVRDTTRERGAPDAFIELPDERAGLAFVFRVFERVSYALIMHTTRPVNPLDVVQTP